MSKLSAGFAVALFTLLAVPALTAERQERTTLQAAAENGLVRVQAISLGGAVGNTLKVTVQRRVSADLHIALAPGTVFVSNAAGFQSLGAFRIQGQFTGPRTYRPASAIVLNDNHAHSYLLETCCMDYHKPAPLRGQDYTLAEPDPRAGRIFAAVVPTPPSTWAYQAALWMDRAGVSAEELRQHFRIAESDLRAAEALLEEAHKAAIASIPADLPDPIRRHLEDIYAPDPAERSEAAEALRSVSGLAAEILKTVEANLPSAPPLGDASEPPPNTPESLAPPDLHDLIRQFTSIPPIPPGVPLPDLPIFRDPKPFSESALENALKLQQSPLPVVRVAAVRLLGKIPHTHAVEAMIDALKDPDRRVREAAADELEELAEQDLGTDHKAWQQWWDRLKSDWAPPAAN